jgi:transcriptional regulator with XRE-family HTH domain
MEKGYTQVEFAGKIGVTSTYVSHLENNRAMPSSFLILKMCGVWGVGDFLENFLEGGGG